MRHHLKYSRRLAHEPLEVRHLLSATLFNDFHGLGITQLQPPDPTAAAGPANLFAMVNSAVGLFSKTGELIESADLQFDQGDNGAFFRSVTRNVNAFRVFDPWVFYDRYSNRYVAIADEVEIAFDGSTGGTGTDEANLLIAISTSDRPDDLDVAPDDTDQDWHFYSISYTHDFGQGLAWGDYPKIAADEDSLYITANYFRLAGGPSIFDGVVVTRLEKAPMLEGTMGRRVDREAESGFTLQPIRGIGRSALEPQLFVDRHRSGIRVWEMNDSNELTIVTTVAAANVEFSQPVPQLGTSAGLDSLSSRMMSAVWRDNSLWTAHTVAVNNAATVRWYQIDTTAGNYSLAQRGDIVPGVGVHTFMPAIDVDAAGNLGVTYTQSSTTQYPTMMFTGRTPADPTGFTEPGIVVKQGRRFFDSDPFSLQQRWGDYAGLSVDPSDDSTFWAFHEYATDPTTWDTWWGKLSFATPPEIEISGRGISIVDGDLSPNLDDGTNLGLVRFGLDSVTATFSIGNAGGTPLSLLGNPLVEISGEHPGDFSVAQPVTPVARDGGSVTFDIIFTPQAIGSRRAVVTIVSDDDDEGSYQFAIEGQGIAVVRLTGDTDDDGDVDIDDLNNVRNNFGDSGADVLGDTNKDNVVNIDDLNNVRNNFGAALARDPRPTSAVAASPMRSSLTVQRLRGLTPSLRGLTPTDAVFADWPAALFARRVRASAFHLYATARPGAGHRTSEAAAQDELSERSSWRTDGVYIAARTARR